VNRYNLKKAGFFDIRDIKNIDFNASKKYSFLQILLIINFEQ